MLSSAGTFKEKFPTSSEIVPQSGLEDIIDTPINGSPDLLSVTLPATVEKFCAKVVNAENSRKKAIYLGFNYCDFIKFKTNFMACW